VEMTTPCRSNPLGSEYFGRSAAASVAAAEVEAREEEEEKERKGSEAGRQKQGSVVGVLVTCSAVWRSVKDMATSDLEMSGGRKSASREQLLNSAHYPRRSCSDSPNSFLLRFKRLQKVAKQLSTSPTAPFHPLLSPLPAPLRMRRALLRTPRLSRSLATSTSSAPLAPLPLKVSTLSNGVRVATDPTPGHFVAAGVYVDAGSRYEGDRTRGAGHMVDRLGFKVSDSSYSSSRITLRSFARRPSASAAPRVAFLARSSRLTHLRLYYRAPRTAPRSR
jgi:hypothetical protein